MMHRLFTKARLALMFSRRSSLYSRLASQVAHRCLLILSILGSLYLSSWIDAAVAAPVVTTTTPVADATDVPLTATVNATFSEAMDPTSITSGSVNLSRFVGIRAIAAAGSHSVLLKNDGTVVAWGENSWGQTNVPVGLSGVTAIAAGSYHSVALKSNGTVVAWEKDDYGQSTIPVGLTGVSAISAGIAHTVTLKNDGTVIAWGGNNNGQATVPSELSGVTAIAAGGFHTVALKNDGTVVAWGSNTYGQTAVPAELTGVTAIAAGDSHTVALKSDGTVVAWGYNYYGQATVPADLTGVAAIAAGTGHTVALKNDGTVVAWGRNDSSQTTVPAELTGVVAIAAGGGHTLALKDDATVVGWGNNGYGQAVVPVDHTGLTAIAAGSCNTLALNSGGRVVGWGLNTYGEITAPAALSGVTAIAAGCGHTLTLNSDSTVTGWGYDNYGQISVPADLTGVIAIATTSRHSVALKSDGTVVAWGYNDFGQTTVPVGLTGVTAIAAGDYNTAALKTDGTVVAWGWNNVGQTTVPTDLTGVTAIAVGMFHMAALKDNGTVVTWGQRTTVPAGLTGVTDIAAGYSHTVALKNNGTVVAWGDNGAGQTTVPAGLTGVIAIAAGGEHSVALKSDGTVVAWGNNGFGQAKVPTSPYSAKIASMVSYDINSRTVTLTPVSPLPSSMTLTATVNSGVRSLAGIHQAADFYWNLSTQGAPEISATPNPLDAGGVNVGKPSATLHITLNNDGSVPLLVNSITIVGSDSDMFKFTRGSCDSLMPTIAAGSGCVLDVVFTPTTSGSKNATLHIASNDQSTPNLDISMSGTGILPASTITTPVSGFVTNGTSVAVAGTSTPDSGSTVALVEVSADGGTSWWPATGTTSWTINLNLPSQGTFIIKSRATTTGGTVEIPKAGIIITIDRQAPTGTLALYYGVWTLNASDGGMCILTYPYICGQLEMSFDGVTWQNATIRPGAGGSIWLRDKAGNISTGFIGTHANSHGGPVQVARITPVYYSFVQHAYDGSFSGDLVKMTTNQMVEQLTLTRDVSVTIRGGYSSSYGIVSGTTPLTGDLSAQAGTATIENIDLTGTMVVGGGSLTVSGLLIN